MATHASRPCCAASHTGSRLTAPATHLITALQCLTQPCLTPPPLHLLQDRFPEHLASMVLINTPFVFRSIWACVRPLLDERVQKKITILGADYSSTLLQVIPPGEGQARGAAC